jgi:hypothetical protein
MDQNKVDEMQISTPSSHQWSHTWKHDDIRLIWLRHACNPRVRKWHVTPKFNPNHKNGSSS